MWKRILAFGLVLILSLTQCKGNEFRGGVLLINTKNEIICGGAVIRKDWVITTARCVEKYRGSFEGQDYPLKVVADTSTNSVGTIPPGEEKDPDDELSEGGRDKIPDDRAGREAVDPNPPPPATIKKKNVTKILVHPEWDRANFRQAEGNIAVLKIHPGFESSYVKVFNESENLKLKYHSNCWVLGFSKEKAKYTPYIHNIKSRTIFLKHTPEKVCETGLRRPVDLGTGCAVNHGNGTVKTTKLCKGDEGHALLCREINIHKIKKAEMRIFGVVSYINDVCVEGASVLVQFTDVRPYGGWIREKVGDLFCTYHECGDEYRFRKLSSSGSKTTIFTLLIPFTVFIIFYYAW